MKLEETPFADMKVTSSTYVEGHGFYIPQSHKFISPIPEVSSVNSTPLERKLEESYFASAEERRALESYKTVSSKVKSGTVDTTPWKGEAFSEDGGVEECKGESPVVSASDIYGMNAHTHIESKCPEVPAVENKENVSESQRSSDVIKDNGASVPLVAKGNTKTKKDTRKPFGDSINASQNMQGVTVPRRNETRQCNKDKFQLEPPSKFDDSLTGRQIEMSIRVDGGPYEWATNMQICGVYTPKKLTRKVTSIDENEGNEYTIVYQGKDYHRRLGKHNFVGEPTLEKHKWALLKPGR